MPTNQQMFTYTEERLKETLTQPFPCAKLQEELKQLKRKGDVIFLTEFVEFLCSLEGNNTVFGNIGCKQIAINHIDHFLDERSKQRNG